MKYAVIAARVILGLMFLVFGLNGLLHFIPNPPMPVNDATTWITIMNDHKYATFVSVLQVIGGLLLLVGRYVPIGLVILGPIIVNILLFHFTLMHGGATGGLIALVLEIFLIVVYRQAFVRIFEADPRSGPDTGR
ncbi:MAG: DoxX family protein [Acidobacteria bacterium]|nr:DoxX family protein [Acidobacteriota bacterium]